MGNCFSDPSSDGKRKVQQQGGQRLGSGPAPAAATPAPPAVVASTTNNQGRLVGDGFEDANRDRDPREMARLAAEQRMKEVSPHADAW